MRDAFDVALGRRGQAGERLGLPRPADAGRALGYRHDASPRRGGNGTRAISGPHSSRSARRPPSTTRPPSSNVHVPIAERLPRPTARASERASLATPYSSASARATASASCVPEPSPACDGSERWTWTSAPPRRWWCARKRRANSRARSASSPSRRERYRREPPRRGAWVVAADAPMPPNQRPRVPRRSRTPKCRRADASTKTASSSRVGIAAGYLVPDLRGPR